MKHKNNQLLKETHKFDVVIWITVSKEMSLAKLQKDLASKLDVKFSSNECETTRVGMLFETLSFKFSRFVMILDDVWERVYLEKRNALKELSLARQSVNGLEDGVIQQLRFSYDRLKDQQLQHYFLNCALYPGDFTIREIDLVHLWIVEGLVEEMNSR
ncbi:hypothetical protein J1N35_023667 [Gossypium stocksii]|uniref:NB-ARC domain-containing protein n=1 Tax=Gossypium stocksii TaxID=47602 RepID=A0A9D3VJB2_9ROSI|nr:hypothetical protein J1N35_023667 [Gossypium stocksii]